MQLKNETQHFNGVRERGGGSEVRWWSDNRKSIRLESLYGWAGGRVAANQMPEKSQGIHGKRTCEWREAKVRKGGGKEGRESARSVRKMPKEIKGTGMEGEQRTSWGKSTKEIHRKKKEKGKRKGMRKGMRNKSK